MSLAEEQLPSNLDTQQPKTFEQDQLGLAVNRRLANEDLSSRGQVNGGQFNRDLVDGGPFSVGLFNKDLFSHSTMEDSVT